MPKPYELNRNLRYEIIGSDKNPNKAREDQLKRLKSDEEAETQLRINKENDALFKKCMWETGTEEKKDGSMAKNARNRIDSELILTKELWLKTRQECLRRLFHAEQQELEHQLHSMGKTIAKVRY